MSYINKTEGNTVRLRFKINIDELDLDQMIAIQQRDLAVIKEAMAMSLVDEGGAYVPIDEARKTIGAIKLSQLKDAIDAFVQEMENTIINPTTDGS